MKTPNTKENQIELRLLTRKQWTGATSLISSEKFWIGSLESHKREVRRQASMSSRIISGQYGYRHVAHATREEMEHFVNEMRSQARKMIKRAADVEAEFRKLQ
jgi:hypothetical protein